MSRLVTLVRSTVAKHRALILLLLGVVALARGAAAQHHPNVEKGFKPAQAYSIGEVDAINLFNGNLNVSLPIGGNYRVGGALSYGFTLAYSGNNWEIDEAEVFLEPTPPEQSPPQGWIRWAVPSRDMNAGIGWLFSLGRLKTTRDGSMWVYQSPDGGEHGLCSQLHGPCDPPTDNVNVNYSRSGTYIRHSIYRLGGAISSHKLEFANGTIQEFDAGGTLLEIRDRSGNAVRITSHPVGAAGIPSPDETACGTAYQTSKIDDGHRVHYIYYLPPDPIYHPFIKERVCQASLAAFGQGAPHADYLFTYANRPISRQLVDLRRPYYEQDKKSPAVSVPLLTKVTMPQGGSYEMLYDIGMYKADENTPAVGLRSDSSLIPNQLSHLGQDLNPGSFSGNLVELKLPTRGRYEWSYQRYVFPPFLVAPDPNPIPPGSPNVTVVAGVSQRKKWLPLLPDTSANEAEPYVWTYSQSGLSESMRTVAVTTVLAPDGAVSDHYFFTDMRLEASPPEYGLPFTRRVSTPEEVTSKQVPQNPYKGLYLSSRTLLPNGQARVSYLDYEFDPSDNLGGAIENNRRVKARMTVFEDGRDVTETYSDFDGLGHHRTTTTSAADSTFNRVATTNFNPGATASGTPAYGEDNWILGTYDFVESADVHATTGGTLRKSRSEHCFDPATGLLLRTRSMRNLVVEASAQPEVPPDPSDLLVVFKDEDANGQKDGNVSQEEYYGGDEAPLPSSLETCGTLGSLTPRYRLRHEYAHGSLKSSRYDGAGFKSVDLEIDPSSGFPSASRDGAGLATTMSYDLLGRLISVKPPAAAWSNYEYAEATATTPPSVRALQCPSGSGTTCPAPLTEERHYYDGLGRPIQQRRRLPNAGAEQQWATTEVQYDGAGRNVRSTIPVLSTSGEYSPLPSGTKSTHFVYDVLGRVTTTTLPDGSFTETNYTGSTSVRRSAQVETSDGPTTIWNGESYDAFGRLVEVIENSLSSGLAQAGSHSTLYSYDHANRITKVVSGVQTRTFDYDGAGLLMQEDHPELAKTHYRYDARGHVWKRTVTDGPSGDVANAATALAFTYDPAERLLSVRDSKQNRDLKVFTYDTTRNGQLASQARVNYFADSTYTVLDTFSYEPGSGRLSIKVTDVTRVPTGLGDPATQQFTHPYEYTDLGAPQSVLYPTCSTCGTAASNTRNLLLSYQNGLLTGIQKVTASASDGSTPGISYTAGGSVHRVQHSRANGQPGVLDTFEPDPDGMTRPRSITFSNLTAQGCTSPSVSVPDVAVIENGTTTLVASAAGSGALHYQWYRGALDDTSLPVGEDSSTYTTEPLNQAADYWVEVTSTCGTAKDAVHVSLVPCGSPFPIEVEPATFAAGVSFELHAPPVMNATYEWYRGSSSNQKSKVATTNVAVYEESNGITARTYYTVEIVIGGCRIPSIELVVDPACPSPTIFSIWGGGTIYYGGQGKPAGVTIVPAGTYTYQWYRGDGTPLNGATGPETFLTTYDLDSYFVRITNACGISIDSKKFYLDVYDECLMPPLTVAQSATSIPAGSTEGVLFVATCDFDDVDMQWYSGQSGDTRNPVNSDPDQPTRLTTNQVGAYWVRASRPCGSHVDSPTLTFVKGSCTPNLITTQPASIDVPYGATGATLTVGVVNASAKRFYWYEENVTNSVGSAQSYTLPAVTTSGRYFVEVRDQLCSSNAAQSQMATVRVASCPSLTPPVWQTEVWTDMIVVVENGQPVRRGAAVTLSVQTGGATSYTWYLGEVGDDRNPVGTGSLYTTDTLAAEGKYWVRSSNATCIVDSPTITVKICDPVHVRTGYALSLTRNIVQGQFVRFSVPMEGTGMRYQWFVGTAPDTSRPIGREVDMLETKPLETSEYWVRVTSHCGIDGSDVRTWDSPSFVASICPILQGPPISTKSIVMPGTPATLSISATGTQLSYQWYIGQPGDFSTPIPASNSSSIDVSPAQTTTYWCEVSSRNCSRFSDGVTVNTCDLPMIAIHGREYVEKGYFQSLTLSGIPAEENRAIQWYRGESGDTSSPHSSQNAIGISPEVTTKYWARVTLTDTGCHADSSTYEVKVCIPTFTAQPQPAMINAGTSATLTVGVDLPNVTYQWYAGSSGDKTQLVAETELPTLTVSPTTNTSYWVRATGCEPYATNSEAALVTICVPSAITNQPNGTNVPANFSTGFSVGATGSNLTYQWYRGVSGDTSIPLAGKTEAELTVSITETTDYWVRVSGSCGTPQNSNTVKVSIPPAITTQPTGGGVVMAGAVRTMTVAATGTQLRYEWHKRVGGTYTVIAGATLPSYTTPPITAESTYYSRVYSGTNHRDSADVVFTTCQLPPLNWGSAVNEAASGFFQVLSVTGIEAGVPRTYAWYRGNAGDTSVPLSSQATLGVSPTVTTSYWVRVTLTDTGCWVDSTTKTINVCRPAITTQPAASTILDKIANPSAFVALTVAADITPVTYQWYTGQPGTTTSPIAGATASTYNASPANDTTYWARVTGSCSISADSAAAVVTVCKAPQITQHPGSLTSPPNFTRQLSVTATGTSLSYQWHVGTAGTTTTPIGSNASQVTISPSQTTDYWVRVTGLCGVVNSNSAKISVAPTITTHPAGGPITSGTTRTLTVAASGTQLRYEWYQRSGITDTMIAGATSASYTTPVITADATYFARVFSGLAFADTATATLTVCLPRAINIGSWTGISASQVTLSVTGPGPGETFEWYRGATGNTSAPLGGGNGVAVSPLETTQYWLRTKRAGCDADTAAVTVKVCIPKINSQPVSSMLASGTSKTLTVAATGTPAMTYQWYIGASGVTSNPISGATGPSYTTPNLTTSTTYWVRITSPQQSCGTHWVNSAAAVITVCQPPVITSQPGPRSITSSTTVTLSVTATGDGLQYQWYEGTAGVTTKPVGSNSNQYTVQPGTTKSFWVRITGTCGTVDSAVALVSVFPNITSHPADVTLCGLGGSATFSVTASGSPLSYEWFRQYNGQAAVVVGTTPTISIPITQVPVYVWAKVTSGTAYKESFQATVTEVLPVPTAYALTKTPQSGGRYLLQSTVAPADAYLVLWKWYEGPLGDTTKLLPTGGSNSVFVQPATLPMTYWVRVSYADTGCATDKVITVP